MFAVGRRLYLLRLKQGLTQMGVSARSGIPQANLSKIEQGTQDPTLSTLLRICSALGVSPAEIFHEEQGRRPFRWTRNSLEKIGQGVAGWDRKFTREEREIVELLKDVLPGRRRRRLSSRRVYQSWYELKQRLSEQEIKTLAERVQDAEQRLGAEQERTYQHLLTNLQKVLRSS